MKKNKRPILFAAISILTGLLLMSCNLESSFIDLIKEKINSDIGSEVPEGSSEEEEPEDTTIAVTGIVLNKTGIVLTTGMNEQLTATVEPADAANTDITWSSSNGSVATVSSGGLVTGPAVGTATITVTTDDGGFTADCTVTVADPGSLDISFGGTGYVTHHNAAGGEDNDWAYDAAIDENGKIIVTGTSKRVGGQTDMIIWRYNADGSLDTSFDSDGIVCYTGGSTYTAWGMEIDANGKIVTAGQVAGDTAVWRYNSDGSPDTTFDTDGLTLIEDINGDNAGLARGMTIDAFGKILVTGTYYNSTSGNNDMFVGRFKSNGSIDTTFHTDGIVTHNSAAGGNGDDYGEAVITDAANRVLVAGFSKNTSGYNDMTIWRYTSVGNLDSTFGGDGIVTANGSASYASGYDIVIDGNGKIVVTGYSRVSGNNDLAVWRFNDNGTPDNTFDSDGFLYKDMNGGGGDQDDGKGITIDADGNILVTGHIENSSSYDMAVWKLTDAGVLDTSYDTDGIVTHDNAAGGSGYDGGVKILMDSFGRTVVAGRSRNADGDDDMTIWRFR